jgi:hypothetical protein
MKIEFKAHKDTLAGFRRRLIIPTIEVADNLWWWKHELEIDEAVKQVVIYIRWLQYRIGVAIKGEKT